MIDLKGFICILGSSSPYRKKILADAGCRIEVMKPEIDEKAIGDRNDPEKLHALPLEIAKAKRDWLLEKLNGTAQDKILITADQIAIYCGEGLEKPKDKADLRGRIERYSISCAPLEFRNGLTVTNLKTRRSAGDSDSSFVHFRAMPQKAIDELARQDLFMTCCSGTMIEHDLWAPHVLRIQGSIDSNIGMPLALLERLIGEVT